MVRIGFVLLTHSNPGQWLRLVRALNELYDMPPIVCHHDFGQCTLDTIRIPENVQFVQPHFSTFWGCFEIVPAALAAIRMLMRSSNPPDWFYLLSGSDYPSQSPGAVRELLARTPYDAFIDHRLITYASAREVAQEGQAGGFSRPSYLQLAYRRYCAVAVPRPALSKPFAVPPVGHSYLRHPAWRKVIPSPFSDGFRCYAGEHWFTANARAAEVILAESPESKRLLRHLRTQESPEECFYHSMLANAPLRLAQDNLRYIQWPSHDAWHPSTLSVNDLPAIQRSAAHFVRKVGPDASLLDDLDRVTGISARAYSTAS